MRYILLLLLVISGYLEAQVGIGTSTPDPSSVLDLTSTSKGFLIPRMTQAQRNAMSPTPAHGLLIFNTTTNKLNVYISGIWTEIASGPIPGDNLGNHTATQNINLNSYWLSGNGSNSGIQVNSIGNVGIGDYPYELLSVGSSGSFRVNSMGNITRINNIPINFPNTQGSLNSVLQNDGSGNLIWANFVANNGLNMVGNTIKIGGTLLQSSTITLNSYYLRFQGSGSSINFSPNGNMGIGAVTPTEKLQIGNGNLLLSNSTANASEVRFAEPSAGGTNYTALKAGAQSSDITYTFPTSAPASGDILSSNVSGNLSWVNSSSIDATTASNGLVLSGKDVQLGGALNSSTAIDATGYNFEIKPYFYIDGTTKYLGIGTTSPTALLHVNEPNNSSGGIKLTSTASSAGGLDIITTSGYALINNSENTPLYLATNNSIRLTITTTGNVGIRNTTPISPLDVTGVVNTSVGYRIGNTSAPIGNFLRGDGTNFVSSAIQATDIPSGSTNYIQNQNTIDQPANFRIVGNGFINGKIGIGTTTPSEMIETKTGDSDINLITSNVVESSSLHLFRSRGTPATPTSVLSSDYFGGIGFKGYNGSSYQEGAVIQGAVDGPVTSTSMPGRIEFYTTTAGSNIANIKMVIKNNGNVGIGNIAPTTKLYVQEANATVAAFNRTGGDGELLNFLRDGTAVGNISVAGGVVSYNAFTGSHYAHTNQAIEPGMLVSLTGKNRVYHNLAEGEIIHGIQKTTIANDPAVMGAYFALLEPEKNASDNNPHQVMAVGNGFMWVVDQGKDLKPGDYLVSSSIEGHAMLDIGEFDVANVIARVAEPVCWANETATIKGVKHKKVAIFFETFQRNNKAEKLEKEIQELRSHLQELQIKVDKLLEVIVK